MEYLEEGSVEVPIKFDITTCDFAFSCDFACIFCFSLPAFAVLAELRADGGTGGSLGLLLMEPVMGGVLGGTAEMEDESRPPPPWLLLLPLLLSPLTLASVLTQLHWNNALFICRCWHNSWSDVFVCYPRAHISVQSYLLGEPGFDVSRYGMVDLLLLGKLLVAPTYGRLRYRITRFSPRHLAMRSEMEKKWLVTEALMSRSIICHPLTLGYEYC